MALDICWWKGGGRFQFGTTFRPVDPNATFCPYCAASVIETMCDWPLLPLAQATPPRQNILSIYQSLPRATWPAYNTLANNYVGGRIFPRRRFVPQCSWVCGIQRNHVVTKFRSSGRWFKYDSLQARVTSSSHVFNRDWHRPPSIRWYTYVLRYALQPLQLTTSRHAYREPISTDLAPNRPVFVRSFSTALQGETRTVGCTMIQGRQSTCVNQLVLHDDWNARASSTIVQGGQGLSVKLLIMTTEALVVAHLGLLSTGTLRLWPRTGVGLL